jgi:hypothetical protein
MSKPCSLSLPPRRVEYVMKPPAALSLVTNTSTAFTVPSKASAVIGKSGEEATPVTTALPEASTAMP